MKKVNAMIGVSLSLPVLTGKPADEAEKELLNETKSTNAFLCFLRDHGAGSIELRPVQPDTEPSVTKQCIRAIAKAGLTCTVHGLLSDKNAEAFFLPILPAFSCCGDSPLVITVHSLATREATAEKLIEYHKYAEKHDLSCAFALENNRIKLHSSFINTAEGVAQTVAELPFMGTCFDFGHRMSDLTNYPEQTTLMPCEDFLKRAIHTHIHGYGERTHYPLDGHNVPLHEYVTALKNAGYAGRYNLELEPGRYFGKYNILSSYRMSLETLAGELK